MKFSLYFGLCLLSLLGSLAPAQAAGKVAGYQYETFPDGDAHFEDNVIHYIPCMPKNNDCIELQESIEAELKQAQQEMTLARSSVENPVEAWALFTQLDQKILPRLTGKTGYQTIKTGEKGVYSFYCPTQNCLVYSYGVTRDRYAYWITLTPGRKRLDLGPARSIDVNKPRNF
ncbi:hypothetical protein [Lyngbya confervoides]|uniref:Uncharacterized protein n=1 Tax=Lyngbya confervoides BDU141951 TaxID=1574623 RepID=A0ABD4T3N7_9CYAN|nr:hypothetical protein [Lyngbya confervoides]MCM1983225.1 hypothetical protein [Lyngbya confervoides BDU141951]